MLAYPWFQIPEEVKSLAVKNDITIFSNKKHKILAYDDETLILFAELSKKENLERVHKLLNWKFVNDDGKIKISHFADFIVLQRGNDGWRVEKAADTPLLGNADYVLVKLFISDFDLTRDLIEVENSITHVTTTHHLYFITKVDSKHPVVRLAHLRLDDKEYYHRYTEILVNDLTFFNYKIIQNKVNRRYHYQANLA